MDLVDYSECMYKTCPRCLSAWNNTTNNEASCINRCGMSIFRTAGSKQATLFFDNIISINDCLMWLENRCYYRNYYWLNKPGIYLPFLDFKIDANKLKLYMTFL